MVIAASFGAISLSYHALPIVLGLCATTAVPPFWRDVFRGAPPPGLSNAHRYDPEQDYIMQRINMMLGAGQT